MIKKTILFSISFVLMLSILAPTVVSFLDVDYEVVIVMESSEEENSLETAKELKATYLTTGNIPASFIEVGQQKNIAFIRGKQYVTLVQDLISPPPEILFFS